MSELDKSTPVVTVRKVEKVKNNKQEKIKYLIFFLGVFLFLSLIGYIIYISTEEEIIKESSIYTPEVLAQKQEIAKNKNRELKKANNLKDKLFLNNNNNLKSKEISLWGELAKHSKLEVKKKENNKEKKDLILRNVKLNDNKLGATSDLISKINKNDTVGNVNRSVFSEDNKRYEIQKNEYEIETKSMFSYSTTYKKAHYYNPKKINNKSSISNSSGTKNSNDNTTMDMYKQLINKLSDINTGKVVNKITNLNTITHIYNNLPPVQVNVGRRISATLSHKLICSREESPVEVIVDKDVYDDTGKYVIFPNGTKINGKSQIITDQNAKNLYIWFENMILPNNVQVVFPQSQRLLALNKEGVLGIVTKVNSHFWVKFGSAILVGLLDGVSGFARNSIGRNSGAYNAIDKTSSNFSDINKQIFQRNSNIVPTITVKASTILYVRMSTNMVISPYCLTSERSYFRHSRTN